MKLLKVGIALCVTTLVIGVVGTGATMGNLYKTSQLVHEIKLEEKLTSAALKNVYITSEVPLRILPTTGEPKVTFESTLTGIAIKEPNYAIDVNIQGDTSYIDIRDKSKDGLGIFFNGHDGEAVLYLPEQMIDTMKVDLQRGDYVKYQGKADMKELVINGGNVNVDLEGNIENIKVDSYQVNMNVNTQIPANVEINSFSNEGKIILDGKYSNIQINGMNQSEIVINSETPYTISGDNAHTNMVLQGAVKVADISTGYGNITIDTTIQPKSLTLESYSMKTKIFLPEESTGFSGVWNYSHSVNESIIYSDFDIATRQIGENSKHIQYGEGGTKLMLDLGDSELYIMK